MPRITFDDDPIGAPAAPEPAGVIRVWGYEGKDVQSGDVLVAPSLIWQASDDRQQMEPLQFISPSVDHQYSQERLLRSALKPVAPDPQEFTSVLKYTGPVTSRCPIRQYQCTGEGVQAASIAANEGRVLLTRPR